MLFKEHLSKFVHFFLCALIGFFLPFGFFLPIFIFLLLVNWLLSGNFFKGNFKLIFILSILYFTHLIGIAYTSNIKSGLFDIQIKLSLFLFPLIIGCSPMIESNYLKKIFIAFILGCALASTLCLFHAFYIFMSEGKNIFFYENLSYFIHPGYFAMYLDFAMILLVLHVFDIYKLGDYKNKT